MTELEPETGGRRWWPIVAGVVTAAVLLGGGFWLATRETDDSVGDATTATPTDTGATTDDDGGTTTDEGDTTTDTEDGEATTTGATTTSGPEPIEFEGEGDETTETFRVSSGWQINWESFGDHFEMTILGDRNLGTVVSVDEPTSGLTTPPAAGEFRIEVKAEGRWTIRIESGS